MTRSTTSGSGKVLLIELSPTVPNLGRFIVMPRYGLLAIASILAERTDYEVKLLFEPYVGRITGETLAREEPRFILLNGLTTTAHDNERLVEELRLRWRDVPVIAGGEHATMYPDEAKIYADYVLSYEGDDTVVRLLEALEEKDPISRDSLLSQISGLHYRDRSGKWRFNREVERVKTIDYRYDFSVVPGAESAAARFRTAHMPLQTSRGCKFGCSFCSWITLYGKAGYVIRPVEDVIHDVLHTVEYTGVRNFIVTDNLFAGDIAYTEELMHGIDRAFEGRGDKPRMTVLCRADQFDGGSKSLADRTIKLMARGGVANVSLGLESISKRSLLQMRKRTDLQQYYAAAECLRKNGIGMLATFVAGFDGDSYEDVVNIAEFGERIGLFTVQVYARNIAPGTIDDILADQRNIPGTSHRYRNGHSVNFLPAQMLPSALQQAIFAAAFRFHERNDAGRKAALRVFRMIWGALRPHYAGLLKLEEEVLIPEGIYRRQGSGYILNNDALHALVEDKERYLSFAKRSANIFADADRMDAPRYLQVGDAPAIA